MKTVIFNVGDAFSAYVECNEKKIVIDLGSGNGFSPVNDFLLPLFEQRKEQYCDCKGKRYGIDQLIISHPHNDHISDICNFDEHFYTHLLTTPNDRWSNKDTYRNVEWDLITDPKNEYVSYMRDNMFEGRNVPLTNCEPKQIIAYLWPKSVHKKTELLQESYTNNISILTFIRSDNYNVLFPGDLQKEGLACLMTPDEGYSDFADTLVDALSTDGVDYLIAPHHGLRSSFSTELFEVIGKTRKLNIIPEKVYSENDSRETDTRYQGSDFCEGDNNESTEDAMVYSHKTSVGHIYIDDNGDFIQTANIAEILEKFK